MTLSPLLTAALGLLADIGDANMASDMNELVASANDTRPGFDWDGFDAYMTAMAFPTPPGEVYTVEQVEPGVWQSVFPTGYADLSALHSSDIEAWQYIADNPPSPDVDAANLLDAVQLAEAATVE